MKYTTLLISAIVYEYQLHIKLEYAVNLLTFINGKFLQWNARDTLLGQIDVIKEKIIIYEF